MAIERVKAFFAQYGIENRVREFDVSSATVDLAAQALGCEPCRIAKTLSFLVDGRAILIVAAGDAKVDNRISERRLQGADVREGRSSPGRNPLGARRWSARSPGGWRRTGA